MRDLNELRPSQVDFSAINRAALPLLPQLLRRWLPDGRIIGREYIARNPKRADRRPGSFKINLETGRWSDFACGVAGGDVVSLAAYLADLRQIAAAQLLQTTLGVQNDRR